MKKKLIPKYWWCETWKVNLYFAIGWKKSDIREWLLKEWKHQKDFSKISGTTIEAFTKTNYMILIWTQDRHLPTIVHECVHAASMSLERCGWKFDTGNEEPFAYLCEAIFGKAIQK